VSGYLLELAGMTAALLLLAPAATAPLPQSSATAPAASQQDNTNWADCLACHADHTSQLPRLSDLRPAGLGRTPKTNCTACHEQTELARFPVSWTHPVRPVGAHVSCLACHPAQPHSAAQPLPAPSGDYEAKGCFGCHGAVKLDFSFSRAHDDMPGVRCKDCHPPHTPLAAGVPVDLQSVGTRDIWLSAYDWRASNELCLRCHNSGDLFGLKGWGGFATLNTVNYHDLHVQSGHALCIECHNPHGGRNHAFIRNTLVTGEVLSYSSDMTGGTCAVTCHGVEHTNWEYINQVF
jgi:hypothetical protein